MLPSSCPSRAKSGRYDRAPLCDEVCKIVSRQLSYLVALAAEKHFAHAAERCNISQPALSLAIKGLEADLGVTIVERGNRFRGFTREGEIVLNWARKMLRDEASLIEELRSAAGMLEGRLRIGVIPSAAAIGAMITSGFVANNPAVSLATSEMTSTDILRAIAGFQIDAAITYIDNEPIDHVRTLAIAREHYVLVTPTDSPLGTSPYVTWREAAELPLCLLGREMQNRRILDGIFERVGAHVRPRIETNSLMSNYCYVRAGWSSIMPRSYVDWMAPPPRMHVAPLVEPEFTTTIGFVIADRASVPLLTAALQAHIERQIVD